MPGSNFDEELKVDSNGWVYPRGPLVVPAGKVITKVIVWVSQANEDGTGALCAGATSGGPFSASTTEWQVTPTANNNYGKFRPGKATAEAMAVINAGTPPKTEIYWWGETVDLVSASAAAKSV
jgi:hypothetical protein